MAKSTRASINLLQLLEEIHEPTIEAIHARVQSAGVTKQSVACELRSLAERSLVVRVKRADGGTGFRVTPSGQRQRDLLARAHSRREANSRSKSIQEIAAEAIADIEAKVAAPESVPFPRAKLRLLASAALSSAKPLDHDLREACLLAIEQAA